MSAEVGALRVNLDLNSASFERGVKGVNLQIKALRSEMTAMMSGNREYANSLDGMKARSENLSRVYDAQKAKVNYLRQEYDRLKAAHGENSKEALRALDAHNRAMGQMNRTESTLNNLNRRIADAENKWRNLGQSLTETGNKFRSVGQSMTSVGQSMAMKITAPIVGIGAAALKVSADFEEGMSKVAAISGATGSDLAALTNQARELGKNTKFSATEAAEGMQYLALAGFKTKDIMSAMPGMLDLAAAGALDLGRAADITSDTMQAFGLSADKATHAADVFAYAQANANTNVEQMGEALKYSAPAAHSFGWSLEETSAATMVFANSGLKGSIAGQAFASSLTRLAHPTKKMNKLMKETGLEFFDAAGNMKSMPDVVKALEVATKDMTQEQKAAHLSVLFGAEAYKHWAILLENGSDKLRSMTKDLENADGAAAKMAKTMSDNLKGKLKTLQSALQEVGIKISSYLLPTATKLTEKLTVITNKFGELSPATQKTIIALAGVAAVIPPLLIAGGALVSSLGAIMTGLGTVSGAIAVVAGGATAATPAVAALAGTFTVLTGPIGLAIAGLAAVGFAAYKVSKELKKPVIETEIFSEKISGATKKAVGSYLKLDEQATVALNQLAWSHKKVTGKMADSMVSKYNQMGERILSSMREKQAKQIEQTQKFFLQSSALSEKEETTILESLHKKNEAEQKKVTEGQARIKEILTKAKNEKRALTEAESAEISRIQDQMRVTAVQTLSKSELEQKAILSRLKSESSKISAEQAAEVVKNSKKQTDQTIQNASVQYEKTKANIEHLRDDLGVISAEQANKLITEAERQRDETKKKAEEMHKSVVEEAKAQAGEHVNQIDWTTGQIKSKWQVFKEDFVRKTKEMSDETIKLFTDLYKSIPKGIEGLKNKIGNLWDELKTKTDQKLKDIVAIVRDSGSGIASAFKSWQTAIGSWFDSMPAIVREKLKSWGAAFKDWIQQQNEENKRQYGIWWDSISTWFTSTAEKIPQKLEEWKVKFSNWFTENQSLIGQKLDGWGTGISDWFTTTRERIYTSLGGWGTRISGWFTEMKTLIPKKLEEWWKNTETWITGKYNSWTSALGSWTKAIGTWFSELPSKTATSISAWGTSIKNSVISLSTGWKSALDSWWTEIKNWFNGLGNKPEVKDSGKKLVNKISEGAGEQKKSFMDNIGKIIVDGLKNVAIIGAVIALSVGRELIKRMINGIEEMHGVLKKAWDALLSLAAGKLKEMAKSVSNSWTSISKNTSEMIGGIKKTVAGLWDDVVDGAKKLPGRIGAGLSKMASGVSNGVKAVANKLAEGLEKGLNGAIKGINLVLGKVHAPLLDHPIKLERYAKGTKGHPGGLAIVGDRPGGGDGPAELIGTPDGNMYLSPAKETLVDLPKGSWVMPGKETKKFLANIPAYNGGVGNYAKGAAKAVSSGFGKVKDFALDVWDYLHDIPGMMKKVWNNFIPDMGLTGTMGDLAKGGLTKVKDGAVDWIKEKVSSIFVGDGWTGGMEKDPGAVGPGSGFGGMMKYVEHWYNQVKNRFGPTRFMGAYNNRNVRGGSSKSMHAYGRAFDIGGSPSTMKAIAEFLRQSATNLQYVIYNRQIAGPGVGKSWRRYSGVNPHVDHVHADFKAVAGGGGIPGGKISGNLSSWITAAMSKAGVSGSNWLQGLAWIINKESSGRPGAVGAMTSTGTAKGLMQLKDFNYKGNPFDPVNNIFYGIKYILGRYKSIEGALSWWRKHNWYKNGTNFHPGGPAVVNDGNGPELIQFPTGDFGMFKGKNVLADLPRGTKVLRHEKTKEIINSGLLGNVPLYAKGVGDLAYIVKAGDTLSKIAKQFKTTVEELVKLNNIKDKNKIQVGQRIVYSKDAPKTGQVIGQIGKPVLQVPQQPQKPVIDTRPQYAKDVTYLMGKAAKEEDAQLAQMKKELNNKLVELEKEKAAKIKAINEKAAKSNQQLLEKEKETQKKIKAIQDKAAKSKRGLTSKEKEQIQKLRADYEKAVSNNKNLTKKDKEQIKKINDDYAKKERAAVNAHNKQISDIEKAAQQKRMQEIDAYVARKKEAGKLSLYDEIQVYRESMRYYKKNSEEWFAAEQKLNQAKVQMHNELKALKDDYLAKVKEVNQRVIDEEKRLNDEYNRALEDRTNAIKGFAGLFDKVEKPEEALDPQGLIDNLHSQVYALNNWRTNLDALANRGIDKGLLEELQAMGPQALAEIKALNDMTDTQLNQFQGLWKDKTEAARLQAQKELSGLKQDTLKQIEQLHRDAEKELDELNKTFTQKVTELRTGAINEFQPFGAQLKDIGTNAVKGLMDGMTDMQGPLKNKMNEISKLMVDTMKKSLEIKSPSRKARREIAGDYGRGILVGLDDLKTPLVSKMKKVANWMGLSPDVPDLAFAAGGNGGGGNSYDYSSTVAPNVVLNYYGSGSEEDAMRMVDIVDHEFSWRAKNKMIARGVRG